MEKFTKSTNSNKKNIIKEKFHLYTVSKVVDWVLRERIAEGKFSEFKWEKIDQQLLNKIINNPNAAGFNLPITNRKFKHFFTSIVENGLNTMDVDMFNRYKNRLPIQQLNWEYNIRDFSFLNKGFCSKKIIPAGFYMLEIGINSSPYNSEIEIELTAKNHKFEMSGRSNRVCKRLIYIEDSSKIQVKLPKIIQERNVYHLRLAKLTRNFFISRILKKIGINFDFKKHTNISKNDFDILWDRYNALFIKISSYSKYERYIKQTELPQIPTQNQQIRNLKLWKKNNLL